VSPPRFFLGEFIARLNLWLRLIPCPQLDHCTYRMGDSSSHRPSLCKDRCKSPSLPLNSTTTMPRETLRLLLPCVALPRISSAGYPVVRFITWYPASSAEILPRGRILARAFIASVDVVSAPTVSETAEKVAAFKAPGNALFAQKPPRYEDAIVHYSATLVLDGENAVLYSNRAAGCLSIG
jgi:hypothetical protein